MTDIDTAKDRAARELARRLEHIVPSSLLADPLAFARQFMDDMTAEHWRPIRPGPSARLDPPNPEASKRGAAHARELLGIQPMDSPTSPGPMETP